MGTLFFGGTEMKPTEIELSPFFSMVNDMSPMKVSVL